MDDLKTGNDLKVWRKNNHLTQKELAEKISYSASRLSHIEFKDELLTKKLIKEVEKYNDILHPKKKSNPVLAKLRVLKQLSLIYGNEIAMIEKGLGELLSIDTRNGYDDSHEYLRFIAATCSNLSRIRDLQPTEDGMKEARKVISYIQNDALSYLQKKHRKN